MTRFLLVLLLMAFTNAYSVCLYPAAAKQAEHTTSSSSARSQVAYFDQNLGIADEIDCRGPEYRKSISFPYPHRWSAARGSTLVLKISHSPSLLPQLSDLSVFINGKLLKTVPLDASNVSYADVVVPLGEAKFKDYNELVLKIVQHYSSECEDPYSSALWTSIGPSSHFSLSYTTPPVSLNLQNWPYPLLDTQALSKTQIGLALPQAPSLETARALSGICSSLGYQADYRPVSLVDGISSGGSVIMVGTPAENPSIAKLSSKLPVSLKSDGFVDESGQPYRPDMGILMLLPNPQDPTNVMLVVTGNGPAGVEKASQALSSRSYNPILGGQAAIIEQVSNDTVVSAESGNTPRMMPNKTSFLLKDLGYKTTTVRGINSPTLKVEANTRPGIKVMGQSQKLRVVFSYGAQLNTRLSTFEVKLNGVTLRSYALNSAEGQEHHEDLVEIPNNLVGSKNAFEFNFHLYPQNIGKCEPLIDKQLWGTLHETTRLDINRDYVRQMPDLAQLNDLGFPIAEDSSLGNTAVVLPAQPAEAALSGLCRLSFLLGQWCHQPHMPITICYDNAVPENIQRNAHLIILNPGQHNKLEDMLGNALTLHHQENFLKLFHSSTGHQLTVKELEHNGWLEEIISPWNQSKLVLVCRSTYPEDFKLAMSALFEPEQRRQLEGSLASISPEGIISCTQSTPLVTINTMPPWKQAVTAMSENSWVPLLLISIMLCLLTWALTFFLRPRKSQ